MRASTVFILALVLLVAFVALAVAKSAGLFNSTPPATPAPPPPTKVLAARGNLFERLTVTADQVYVRELRPEEERKLRADYGEQWKDKLLPAMPGAAHLRTVRQNILADQILFKNQFDDIGLPDSLSQQLEPNTRAVNVTVQKDRAAGGVLRVGEFVDVFLTAKVEVGSSDEVRTACIARGCKVIMKRNTIWSIPAADPDGQPLHFTLQANLYRAALIEYAQAHGNISLLPGSPPAKINGSFSDPSSKEYASEDQRVDEMVRGIRTITNEDLVRIFQIPPRPIPVPPVKIQHLVGVSEAGYTTFPTPKPLPAPAPQQPVQPAGGTLQGGNAAPQGGQGSVGFRPVGDKKASVASIRN